MYRPIQLSEKDVQRFWSKVERLGKDECWTWLGSTNPDGYGRFNVDHHLIQVHRIAFYLEYHVIDNTLEVCHSCDNPPCCNPAHLFQGDHFDNMQDMTRKGRNTAQRHPERSPRGDKHGARLHPERHWNRTNHPEIAEARRGEGNPSAKLAKVQVSTIRVLHSLGISRRALCALFKVSKTQLARIVNGRSWKDD